MGWFKKRKSVKQTTLLSKITDNRTGEMVGTCLLTLNQQRIRGFSDLVYFTLRYGPTPLPSSDDFDRFDKVEARLDELAERLEFCCVAVWTIEGKRDWILYAKDGPRLLTALHAAFSVYSPEIESMPDPRWSQYRDLVAMNN